MPQGHYLGIIATERLEWAAGRVVAPRQGVGMYHGRAMELVREGRAIPLSAVVFEESGGPRCCACPALFASWRAADGHVRRAHPDRLEEQRQRAMRWSIAEDTRLDQR